MTIPDTYRQPNPCAYAISVTIGWHAAQLRLHGEIDLAAADELTRTLDSLDRMPPMAVHVDLSDVTFLDSTGVLPLVQAARRRRDNDLPPLLISSPSSPVLRLLRVTRLGVGPQLDIEGWDQPSSPR